MSRNELQQWMFKLISEYQKSGQTQSAFCKDAGISLARFKYWLSKYFSENNKPVRAVQSGHTSKSNFVEVVTMVPSREQSGDIDIIFPNGVRVNMSGGSDGIILGKVIKSW